MPFPRRGRRRPPFRNARWQQRTLPSLRLHLAPTVRTALTAWMKIYGETNDLPGLVTGPIEVRFRRLREHAGADTLLLWTTPEHWAAGEALSLWIPAIGLDLKCRFENGGLHVERARPTTDQDRDPRELRSAVGIELRPGRVELPPPDHADAPDDSAQLEGAFERLIGRRWSGFVAPLREALEAEAKDDAARAERLATGYATATPRIGGQSESDPYRLSGVEASAVAAFEEGEWLDLLDTRGRTIASARLVRADPTEGVLDVDARGADPPSSGTVRPRPQTQILAQKRAILDELDNPTGGLRDAVRLVASPASLPLPARRRPASFVNRLMMRNRSQVRAVSLALGLEEGQALMIQGPPGTGKSTTLAEILGQLVLRDPNATVLVCSHSNHGVDNLLLKTLPYLEPVSDLAIARVGLYDRVHPDARAHFVPPGEDLGAYNVVFTTVDALALQSEAGARTYDYAVLDEANRASILDSLIPLVRGRRFILVGDHLQLQPVLSDAEEQLRLEPAQAQASAIGKSLFAWLREKRFPDGATVFLDEQNRMHPVIAGLISEVFYDGRLRSGPRAPRRPAHVPLFPAPVTWVDTRGLHGLREARGRGASLMNVPEARLVSTIARHFLATAPRDPRSGLSMDVGVIAAYAEQTALLRRLLHGGQGSGARGQGSAKDRSQASLVPGPRPPAPLEVDTVDAFEGREKDVIVVSLVRSNRRRDIGFLRLMQRINVALSRARRVLVIVGDASTLRGSYFDHILRYVRANGTVVPGPRLIGRLLNARSADREAPRAPVTRRRAGTGAPPPPRLPQDRRGELPPTALPAADPDDQRPRSRRRRRRGRRVPGDGPGGPQAAQRGEPAGGNRVPRPTRDAGPKPPRYGPPRPTEPGTTEPARRDNGLAASGERGMGTDFGPFGPSRAVAAGTGAGGPAQNGTSESQRAPRTDGEQVAASGPQTPPEPRDERTVSSPGEGTADSVAADGVDPRRRARARRPTAAAGSEASVPPVRTRTMRGKAADTPAAVPAASDGTASAEAATSAPGGAGDARIRPRPRRVASPPPDSPPPDPPPSPGDPLVGEPTVTKPRRPLRRAVPEPEE